ncbi:FAD binding domain protein [Xylariaceae sp. FL0804]|nr:FAD binding domain protein [Xylariaceae sp. FL0804]
MFLQNYNLTGIIPAFTSNSRRFVFNTFPNMLNTGGTIKLTSWGLMHRILRANYNGQTSTACPHPPAAGANDGSAVYLTGIKVTALQYADRRVTVYYTDIENGQDRAIEADLIISANGVHSTIRQLIGAPIRVRRYAGYIAWRGTLPERALSTKTAKPLLDRLSFNFCSNRTYIVYYIIPTDDGSFEPRERLLNWVWYYNVDENAPEMAEIFTNVKGHLHQNTVPRGLIRPAVWQRARKSLRVTKVFAELLNKTANPFITKIRDVSADRACFYEGKVVLVGDAFSALRPQIGAATEQAALHSNTLEEIYRGAKTHNEWEKHIQQHTMRIALINEIVAELGRGSILSLIQAIVVFFLFVFRQSSAERRQRSPL